MKINSYIKNPVLRYKLDPGEPGLASPTPASRSIAKVATHEATNIRRFKREALQSGGVVVFSSIKLNLSYQGSFLAATSGRSKATIVYPVKNDNIIYIDPEPVKKNTDDIKFDKINKIENKNIEQTINNDIKKPDLSNLNSIQNTAGINNIKNSINELEIEKTNLLSQMNDLNQKTNNENNSIYFIKDKLNKIENKIMSLNQLIEIEKQKSILNLTFESKNFAYKLLGLKYNKENIENLNGNIINAYA